MVLNHLTVKVIRLDVISRFYMQQELPIIDMEFGTTQLSGNRSLFIKLLKKFKDEYAGIRGRITACIEQADQTELKLIVHTIKGVSGNLGLKVLHQASRTFESEIIEDAQTDAHASELFILAVEQSFNEIDALDTEQPDEPQSALKSVQLKSPDTLIKTLERNEYIPPDELSTILASIDAPKQSLEKVQEAINDLDYPSAISVLKSL